MKIKLIFLEWKRRELYPVSGSEMQGLEAGDFHGGSTFNGTIALDEEQETELRHSMANGHTPTFWVMCK